MEEGTESKKETETNRDKCMMSVRYYHGGSGQTAGNCLMAQDDVHGTAFKVNFVISRGKKIKIEILFRQKGTREDGGKVSR